jgi:hypothetical protein
MRLLLLADTLAPAAATAFASPQCASSTWPTESFARRLEVRAVSLCDRCCSAMLKPLYAAGMHVDELLNAREKINKAVLTEMAFCNEHWGIEVVSYEGG